MGLRTYVFGSALLAACVAPASTNESPETSRTSTSAQHVSVTELVADQANAARFTDDKLVNAWGLVFYDDAFWIADNATGTMSVVGRAGNPMKGNDMLDLGEGITGIAVNDDDKAFLMHAGSCDAAAAELIVASEAGTLIGVNPDVDAKHGVTVVDHSKDGAIYKSVAIANTPQGTELLAADFHNGRVDAFDSSFHAVRSAFNVTVPADSRLAPFDVAAIGDAVYVTYAVQDADAEDDVKGAGNGLIAKFDLQGNLMWQLQSDALDSPWGLAVAPSGFGGLGGALLVGNFGDGAIHAFDTSGTNPRLLGALADSAGKPIMVDGLWGLLFGEADKLYFTAGPEDETHGRFGVIQVNP